MPFRHVIYNPWWKAEMLQIPFSLFFLEGLIHLNVDQQAHIGRDVIAGSEVVALSQDDLLDSHVVIEHFSSC